VGFGDPHLLVATVLVDVLEDFVGVLVDVRKVGLTEFRLDALVNREGGLDLLADAIGPVLLSLVLGDVLL